MATSAAISVLLCLFFCGFFSLSLSLSDSEYESLLELRNEIFSHQENLNMKLDSLGERIDAIYSRDMTLAGFTAIKTSKQRVDSGNTITFEKEVIDYGGNYNTDSSVFVCPSTAVYFVTANLERERDVKVSVLVNNNRQLSLRDTRAGLLTTEYNSVTSSMLVLCEFNWEIKLQATDDNDEIYGDEGNNREISTFTVFRINDPILDEGQPVPETYQPETAEG